MVLITVAPISSNFADFNGFSSYRSGDFPVFPGLRLITMNIKTITITNVKNLARICTRH